MRKHTWKAAVSAAAICAATAFSPAYAETKQATLKATGYEGSTTLTNFQALVKLSASNDAYGFSYNEAGGSTATNIWFTDAGGTPIPHDIDTWNTSGDSFVWVKIPTLTNGTEIVMHWSDDASDVQTASGNVWTNFVGVWHMNATGKTAEPDKTGHGLSATPMNDGGTAIDINSTTGQIGSGRSFATSFNRMKVEGHKGKLTNQAKFTIGGWVCRSSTSQTHPRIFVGNPTNSDRTKWEVFAVSDKSYKVTARGGSTETAFDSIQVGSGTWYYLVAVFDGQTATVYCNGTSFSGPIANSVQGDYFTIGGVKVNKTGSGDSRAFLGTFDEVRMYNGVLSADRVAADYTTMHTPAAFLTLVSDNTPVTAAWTGGGNDGDVSNADNWACTNSAGTGVSGLPAATTDVTVSGDNLNIQIPSGSSFLCKSFTLGSCSLAADCDLRGVGTVTIPSGVTVDLKDRALFVQGLAGDGVITNTANGTYTTLDFIRADNSDGSQYIITDYTPRYSDTFLTKVNFQNQINQCIYCARGGSVSSGSYSCLTYGGDGRPLRFDHVAKMGDSGVVPVPALDTDYEFIVNGKTGVCKLNGANVYTMATSDDDTATAASALSFFVLNNNADGTALANYVQANFKMYFFRIYGADGALIRDYVPAKNGNGVAGLWERVGNTFLPSAGGTAFIAGNETGRGELVFHVPSGATATRSGVTIAASVIVSKEGEGELTENALGYSKTKASSYNQREGTVRFTPSTDNYLDLGPTNYCISGGTLTSSGSHLHIGRERTGRFIQNGGTVSMSSYYVYVGIRASGEYDLTGGELNGVNNLLIGYGNAAVGTMGISGGKMTVGNEIQVGANGTGHGELLQTGGEIVAKTIVVPLVSGASGEYSISNGTSTITNGKIGFADAGTLSVSGGTLTFTDLQVGSDGSSGRGKVLQTGGSVTTGTLNMPTKSTSSGEYCISDGTLAIGNAYVGNYGSGSVIQRGGSCTVTSYFWIGGYAGGEGLYEMTGGTLSSSGQPVAVGRFGTGALNVSGSAVVTAEKGVRVGLTHTNGSGTGTLVVTNGGTIATTSIYGGGTTAAQASVLFDNATVKAMEAGEILKDLHDVTISAGGLTITNDFVVSITNTTLKVTPGTTAITMTGTGTLDLSNATVQFASTHSRAFYFAVAQGGGTLTGLPTVTRPWKAHLTDGGTRCKISKGGFMILVK